MSECNDTDKQQAVIKVIGVGGGGCNAVYSMIPGIGHKVDLIAADTNVRGLDSNCQESLNIQIGKQLTKGLGAGSSVEVGREAAIEDLDSLQDALKGADLVFIAAGMGGGTGTGAAPVIAEAARSLGALVVGIVTKPFTYEGNPRTKVAEQGISELKTQVDSLIIIPNDRLISLADKNVSLFDAFKPSDDVLRQAVQGIAELITVPGQINVDFADVKTVMGIRGMGMIGIGTGSGENRASTALHSAISSALLLDNDISDAKGVLINITGSSSITMNDYETVSGIIHGKVHESATIKIGVVLDEDMGETIKVTVIVTGFGTPFDGAPSSKIRKRGLQLVEKPASRNSGKKQV